jgi:hypothetical protein
MRVWPIGFTGTDNPMITGRKIVQAFLPECITLLNVFPAREQVSFRQSGIRSGITLLNGGEDSEAAIEREHPAAAWISES